MRKNKYNNQKVIIDGRKYDSKKEASRAFDLQILEKVGKISNLEYQVRFRLLDGFEYMGEKIRPIDYIADFVYLEGNNKIIEDVKSFITRKNPDYKIKIKLLKKKYNTYIFKEYL